MSKLRYWLSSARELDGYIQENWKILTDWRNGQNRYAHAEALRVEDTLLETAWYTKVLRERLGMPKKEFSENKWIGFVDVKLTSAEKETYAAWDVHDADLWLLVVDAIVSGHKLSVTHNKQNDQFVASFTALEGSKPNAGYTLSAFGREWYDAVRVLMFKHVILLDGDWSIAKDRVTDSIG